MSNKLISIRNLSVRYGLFQALENIDLDIYDDDFLVITGPNGGGKTTLLRAILGSVAYEGIIDYSPTLMGKGGLKIGYLPQQALFDRHFPISALEVVLSGLQNQKGLLQGYTAEDKNKARDILTLFGIQSISKKPIGELSGGQMQRTLLCRALISQPKMVLLDEPANFIDRSFEKVLYESLKEISAETAIIVITHNPVRLTGVTSSVVHIDKTLTKE